MTRQPAFGSAQPSELSENSQGADLATDSKAAEGTTASPAARALDSNDLEAALQLLVQRAQYITGATGAALALAQGSEMVCRASAGSCAPPIGARLQVKSGLTGESVSRKQLLRCDNAENDPRVNLETCKELGIASIVVLPLLSASGEVRGLFELFSDHAYAFEERDLVALERMAELTRTALDLAEKATIIIPARPPEPPKVDSPADRTGSPKPVNKPSPEIVETKQASQADAKPQVIASSVEARKLFDPTPSVPESPVVPEAMRRIQKCSSCGFPVSEGRTLCMDCERKQVSGEVNNEVVPAEFVPSFGLSSSAPAEESWLANHVNLLAILVLILSIVVAVVVFR